MKQEKQSWLKTDNKPMDTSTMPFYPLSWIRISFRSRWTPIALAIALSGVSFFSSGVLAEDWLQFRGPEASGLAIQSNPPIEFTAEGNKNIAWRSELPGRSAGGAIVVGSQVIATSSQGLDQRRIYVTSVDAATGQRNWQQSFVARGRPFSHPIARTRPQPPPAMDKGSMPSTAQTIWFAWGWTEAWSGIARSPRSFPRLVTMSE